MPGVARTGPGRGVVEAAEAFRRLADPTRLAVLVEVLGRGSATSAALSAAIGMRQEALTHHLSLLRASGLVAFERDGKAWVYRAADPARLRAVLAAVGLDVGKGIGD
jgi:DNA-binding transcriptional ArsR family regulator